MNVNQLAALAPELSAVAPKLSDEVGPNGEDCEAGNASNLADALRCLEYMEPAGALAHAREHLPAMVARVSPALDREAPELAGRLRAAVAEVL
jgi:hypothetical protein